MSSNVKPTGSQQGTYNAGTTQAPNQWKGGTRTQSGSVSGGRK